MKKPLTQDELEASNLLEESSELMSECISCGLCKSHCPVFNVLREERISGRGHAVSLRNKHLTKSVFESSLSSTVEDICPKGVSINAALLKAREAAVLSGLGLEENEKMIQRLREFGSPYGKQGEEDTSKAYS